MTNLKLCPANRRSDSIRCTADVLASLSHGQIERLCALLTVFGKIAKSEVWKPDAFQREVDFDGVLTNDALDVLALHV